MTIHKKKGRSMKVSRILSSILAIGLAYSGAVTAQDDNSHGIMNVRMTTVKAGMAGEYMELLGQLAESRKAAGHSGVDMWQIVRGPVSSFYQVSTIESMSVFDGQFDSGMSDADWARWIGRITDVIDHSVVTTYRTHPELAVSRDSDSPPNMMLLRFSVLKPGQGGDHHEWLAESLVPNMIEGNIRGWTVADAQLGDDANTWVSATRFDSWAQMEGPGPFAHMSERARNNMLEDYFGRVQSARTEVIRYLPDISY
jgi:hypothetical protein